MAADREPPSLIDYVVTAISPVLVMLMVGSLVFFLVEVLYAGQYTERLLYTMFFFVAGSVLVARIAIQVDRGRATVYGVVLAAAAFAALAAYVEYPAGSPLGNATWLANLGLIALIWWSANKLTWDCTHLDETQDVSGRGVLSAAGFGGDEASGGREPPDGSSESGGSRPPLAKKKDKNKRKKADRPNWVWRWWSHRQGEKQKPHTPGVWVIYFALAALPLFAVGQSLVDPDDADRRRATFLQMAVYVASALGLLATTSLLGLRRYLRQRKATMPGSLTAGWLGLGAGLIVVFVVVGAVLPRPHSETPLLGLQRAGKSERGASRYAQLSDSAGKGEGNEGEQSEKGAGKASGKGGDPGGSKGEKGSGGKGQGKGNSGGGKDGKGGGKGQGKSNSDAKGSKGNNDDGKNSDDKGDGKESGDDSQTDREAREAKDGNSGDRSSSSRRAPETKVGGALEKVAGVVKWVVIAIVVVLVVVGIALAVLNYLAPFTGWARRLLDAIRNWWANLFGRRASRERERPEDAGDAGPVRPPPFSAFSDPFADGTAPGRDPAELVAYTFAALDAWAWDRGHGRRADETPLEFAARLGDEYPDLAADLRRLAGRYARVAYSEGPLPADTLGLLEEVWDQLAHGVPVAAAD
ncbi:MAG: DUF4129 domain-containing protein [Gemmataceae bacterium]|nr:DUF4129 domain-containing protein [Gemmataceae bacterium]